MKTLLLLPYLLATMVLALGACSRKTIQSLWLSKQELFNKITIEPVRQSQAFPDAGLTISQTQTEVFGPDSVKFKVAYVVKNYELTKMTMDMTMGECANSAKGQHIHYILDNKPYVALYKPENTVNLAINSEHYLLSFLSRSYHEAIKTPTAAILLHFKIDGQGNFKLLPDVKAPMLFYSRPKGEYVGKDVQNVLLDFYVKNTILAANGHKVRLSVNDRQFILSQWKPYFIKNLPLGNIIFKLELLDAEGNKIQGDNTAIEREVVLK
ncbi:MAG: hypothetical protein EAZ51_05760 [Sphingobacteriales bacterium]|nr:MAG: hypothetical protein EAZ64_01935 [Sphingobacteriales bacterium]TAF80598.1 MAG: hypothetical protein EAZ51_05760 [Sphingobacteriales bacterium]